MKLFIAPWIANIFNEIITLLKHNFSYALFALFDFNLIDTNIFFVNDMDILINKDHIFQLLKCNSDLIITTLIN
jgi:hypothetical protein